LRAPGKLVRSSRWKTGPSKGQRPLGSECCVATGDSGDEAYTAIAWGVGLSLERSISQGPRVFIRSKATCAAPLCEVLTPCRGPRAHHVQKDRIGSWEISSLTGNPRTREMAGAGRPRLLQLPRSADQRTSTECVPAPCHRPLATHA